MISTMRLMRILATGTALLSSNIALADGPFALVTGCRDPRVVVIDIAKAIDPAKAGTSKAIVSRVRVTPDVPAIDPSRINATSIGINVPRTVSVTPDDRYAVVAGGEANNKAGGTVRTVDLLHNAIVGTVTGVGNEPYLLAITDRP